MVWVYIAIVLLFRVVQAIFSKRSSMEMKNMVMLLGYTAYSKVISAVLGLFLILIGGRGFVCDWLTVVIATASGVSLFFSTFFSIYAMKSGTVSLSSMFGTAGMIIPILAGVFLFGKPVSLMQYLGVVLFFVSAYLLVGSSKNIYKNFSFKTVLLLIGTLVANGSTMLCQQLFTQYVPDGDVSVFSFLSFGIIAVLSAIFYRTSAVSLKVEKQDRKMSKMLLVCGMALAVSVFVINQLATISTALISPVILFTFINGGGTIISTVVAAIMYKEKIDLRTVLGISIGVASLIIIKAFEVG